ncbi:MAG: chorismate synthase [Calditrichaeota bacterium]|nr:chorismate synthase [Calditrichota bacterium]
MRFLTAGESHGPGLAGIIEGLPANLPIDIEAVNHELFRRQQGFGRGARMKMEKDRIEVLSGVRFNKTLGSPVSFVLRNKDWDNWRGVMAQGEGEPGKEITKPRPGHADLPGALKYNFNDMRNVLERSSARETAMRVAVGGFCKQLLSFFDIKIYSHVLQIGPVKADAAKIESLLKTDEINEIADKSPVRCLDKQAEVRMVEFIKKIKQQGDTAGGIIQIIIRNVPPGLGSHVHWDKKLDGRLAAALMSVQAVKGVEVGIGFGGAELPGSLFHDEIFYDGEKIYRKRNNAGGIEGGMSNGEDIVLHIFMKPIPTLMRPLRSVDIKTKKPFDAHKERSDVTAVPACSVVAEAAVAPVIANALCDKFGCDTVDDMSQAYKSYLERIHL